MRGALLLPYEGRVPRLLPGAWVAPGATLVGDVELGPDSSVWYGCVLRGDVHSIRVGARTNLQDGSVVHVTAGRFPAEIGDEVSVGHRAVVHGCRVGGGRADRDRRRSCSTAPRSARKRSSEPAPS